MILSFNVVNSNNLSSEDESLEKDNIKPEESNCKVCIPLKVAEEKRENLDQIFIKEIQMEKLTKADTQISKKENQSEFVMANFKIVGNMERNMKDNSPLSNENSFSEKEEDVIQQDLLNLLNSSLKLKNEKSNSRESDNELQLSVSSLSSMENKFKDLQVECIQKQISDLNTAAFKNENEKIINISYDSSMVSDVSQESKNFIPKASLVQGSPQCKEGINLLLNGEPKKKIKDDLKKPTMASYYKDLFPVKKFESDGSMGDRQAIDYEMIYQKREEIKTKEKMSRDLQKGRKNNVNIIKDSSCDMVKENGTIKQNQCKIIPENTPSLNVSNNFYARDNNMNTYVAEDVIKSYNSNSKIPSKVLPDKDTYGDITGPPQMRTTNVGLSYNNNNPKIGKMNRMYKSNPNYTEMNLENLIKYSHLISKDQVGCRLLQKKIDDNPSLANDQFFYCIYDKLFELMYDSFGNYFVQKVIENITEDKLIKLVKLISTDFKNICLDCHGTRVIQKILEKIKNEPLLQYFTELLTPHMNEFIIDPNACHIMIKYASTVHYPKNNVIFEFLACNVVDIATQKHSCCALQKCMEVGNPTQRTEIFKVIAQNALILITDAYGNYVVQFVVTFGDYEINNLIVHAFLKDIAYLSRQKFSSNVIEKCFDFCDDDTKMLIVKELCNPQIIPDILLDMYGNYVLQKALACAVEPYYSVFIYAIGPQLERLKTVNFGSKLHTKLLICYPELNNFVPAKKESESKISGGSRSGKKCQKQAKKNNAAAYSNNNSSSPLNVGMIPMNLLAMNMERLNVNPFVCYSSTAYQPNMMMNFGQFPFYSNQPQYCLRPGEYFMNGNSGINNFSMGNSYK